MKHLEYEGSLLTLYSDVPLPFELGAQEHSECTESSQMHSFIPLSPN